MKNNSKIQKQYAEIIFLDYISKHHPDVQCDYPSYLKDELDVSDTHSFLRKLVRAGYANREKGHYVLSETGAELLAEHEDYVAFFTFGNLYVSIQEYLLRKEEEPDKSFDSLMTDLMLEKAAECKEKKNFLAEKKLHLDIAVVSERLPLLEQALQHYLTVLYMDVNAVEYLEDLQNYREGKMKKEKVKAGYDFTYIRPDVQAGLKRLRDVYTEQFCDTVYEENDLGVEPCDKAHFISLVKEIMDGSFSEMEWQKYFSECFKKLLASIK